MSRGSAFARVIGMTRSLSPLAFDRSRKDDGEGAAFDLPPGTADDSPALPPAQLGAPPDAPSRAQGSGEVTGDMFEAVEAAMVEENARPPSATVTPFPALAKVTVVSNSPEAAAAVTQPEALAEAPPAEISGDMIEAIESDIASLLASLNQLDDAAPLGSAPIESGDEEWHDAEDEAGEEPTLALLSELNRMWQADPEVISDRV